MHPLVAAAEALATGRLAPAAADVEAAGEVPAAHLDALAEAGLFGVVGPASAGGAQADPAVLHAVAERLAAGCLSTAFVWQQHHGALRALAVTANAALRDRWLAPLCRGEAHAGVAFSALRRPGPPAMVAAPADGGWRLDGEAPWVTGWGHADVLRLAARHGEDVVWLLVDAAPGPTLRAERVRPVAVDAADTVVLRLAAHGVPDERVLGVEPFEVWRSNDRRGGALRFNGSLALGLARRCLRALEEPLDPVDAARDALDAATGPATMAAARAAASDLALRTARALVVRRGGSGILRGDLAERSAREALFLLVFAQTPAIRTAQLGKISVNPGRV